MDYLASEIQITLVRGFPRGVQTAVEVVGETGTTSVENASFTKLTAMKPLIYIEIPFFPPSVNRLHVKSRWGGLILSTAARKFQAKFSGHVATNYLPKIGRFVAKWSKSPKNIFRVRYRLYFERKDILNATYNSKKSNKARSPYKRMDAENLSKFLSDCLSRAIQVDDCRFFETSISKHLTEDQKRLEIRVYQEEPAKYGLPF